MKIGKRLAHRSHDIFEVLPEARLIWLLMIDAIQVDGLIDHRQFSLVERFLENPPDKCFLLLDAHRGLHISSDGISDEFIDTLFRMEPSVKREGNRQYDASRRQEAAAETQRAIISAARQLFLEKGYAATTMPAIAKAAGVSLDTVYASAGAKPVLFRHLIETAISGTEDPIPALQRNYVREIQAEPDPVRKIAIYAHAVRLIQPRLAPLFAVLRDAAQSDDDLRQLWADISQRRAANMHLFAAELAASS